MENKINYTEKAIEALGKIGEAEPEFMVALSEAIVHIGKTYDDKYEGGKEMLNTKAQLYHPVRGAAIGPYQISRYLQRFMSDGFQKSGNKNDMLKIVHYALFDVVRMNRCEGVTNSDIVDHGSMGVKEFESLEAEKPTKESSEEEEEEMPRQRGKMKPKRERAIDEPQ